MLTLAAESTEKTFWLPEGVSTFSWEIDYLFIGIFWVTVFFSVLIFALMALFLVLYRDRPGYQPGHAPHHDTTIEVLWSGLPGIVLLAIFFFGLRGYLDLHTPPANAYDVQVTAFKWGWSFTYPNGGVSNKLVIPKDRPIRLVMESSDVIHSLFIPAFRAKKDCVPGRFNTMWFEATEYGTYNLFCTEYCGTRHSDMITTVEVVDDAAFVASLDEFARLPENPVEAGELVYNRYGCTQCHTPDGGAGIGPTFKNLYGSEHPLTTGENVKVDEDYIRRSILYPGEQIVAGYQNVMPSYEGRLKSSEINALIRWMKSISDKYTGDTENLSVPFETSDGEAEPTEAAIEAAKSGAEGAAGEPDSES